MIITDTSRTVDIRLRDWDEIESQYGPEWSRDFYDAGLLTNLNPDGIYEENEWTHLLEANGYSCEEPVYKVDDVSYCIDYARDMIEGHGDFEGNPSPRCVMTVTEIKGIHA